MTETLTQNDIDRVGLSEKSKNILDNLVAEGYFKDSLSVYRLAVSLAIKNQIDIFEHKVNRPQGHMYLISQVDPNSIFAIVIAELFPEYKDQKYRALEKFADLGVQLLQEQITQNGSVVFWETSHEAENFSL